MTLYEIKQEYLDVLNSISVNEDGEIENIEELEALEARFEDKAEAVACYIKEQDALADAIKAEEKSLSERRKALENKCERLRRYLAETLIETGRDKFETSRCKLSFRKSVVVEIPDESIIPKEYMTEKVTVSPNKTLIKDELKNGVIIEGASLVEKKNLQLK